MEVERRRRVDREGLRDVRREPGDRAGHDDLALERAHRELEAEQVAHLQRAVADDGGGLAAIEQLAVVVVLDAGCVLQRVLDAGPDLKLAAGEFRLGLAELADMPEEQQMLLTDDRTTDGRLVEESEKKPVAVAVVAIELHRDLAQAQLSRDLLVHQAARHQCHDLAFARG